MTDIRLYMFQTGSLKCKVHNIKMNQGGGADYEIPVPFFLLTHPDGHTLIDGGNAVETATDPKGYWGGITEVYWPVMREDEGCVAQLKKWGSIPKISGMSCSRTCILIIPVRLADSPMRHTSFSAVSTSMPLLLTGLLREAISETTLTGRV